MVSPRNEDDLTSPGSRSLREVEEIKYKGRRVLCRATTLGPDEDMGAGIFKQVETGQDTRDRLNRVGVQHGDG